MSGDVRVHYGYERMLQKSSVDMLLCHNMLFLFIACGRNSHHTSKKKWRLCIFFILCVEWISIIPENRYNVSKCFLYIVTHVISFAALAFYWLHILTLLKAVFYCDFMWYWEFAWLHRWHCFSSASSCSLPLLLLMDLKVLLIFKWIYIHFIFFFSPPLCSPLPL